MINFLPAPLLYCIGVFLFIVNTSLWSILIMIGAIIKLLLPLKLARQPLNRMLNFFMWVWAGWNWGIVRLISKVEMDVKGLEGLSKEQWYLLISNHLSGLDIVVHSSILRNHMPMLRFFIKRELFYVPLMGLACWAMDMPFMYRTRASKLKKNPKLKGKDLQTTRKLCEKYKHAPTAIINYVEGSRFTAEKQALQGSPYRHLLRPKAGGVAQILGAMGEQFTHFVNVTLVYPDAQKNILNDMLNGKLKKIIVRIQVQDVPKIDSARYLSEPAYRAQFQQWLNKLWQQKDDEIDLLLKKNLMQCTDDPGKGSPTKTAINQETLNQGQTNQEVEQ